MSEKQEDITKTQEQAQEQPKRKESWFDKNPIITAGLVWGFMYWTGRIVLACVENRRNRS